MNKKVMWLVVLLGFFFGESNYLISKNKVTDDTESWRFDSFSLTKKVNFNSQTSEDGMSLEIFMNFPEAAPSGIDLRKIQGLISKIALDNDNVTLSPKGLFAELTQETEDLAHGYAKEWEENNLEGLPFSTYELIRYIEANMLINNSVLVVSNLGYLFLGGAHGATTLLYSNINIEDYSIIKESDLFKIGYKKKLAKLIQAEIEKRNNSADEDDHISLLVSLKDIVPNGNFYFTEGTLVYLYNQYEIAPYVEGQVKVQLSYKDLLPLVKDEYKTLFNKLIE